MLGHLLNDRYQLLQSLSSGGMDQTYLATDTHRQDQPQCVVKQLLTSNTDAASFDMAQHLFEREATMLQQLGSHAQIPSLLDYFESEGNFYLVQDWIDAEALSAEFGASPSPWSDPDVIQYLTALLPVLDFVHRHRVIHRDIKPSHILRRRSDHKLMLTGFGAVKQVQSPLRVSAGRMSLTPTMVAVIGTVGYMPQEQLAGQPGYASDIYALGMVAIEGLTQRSPTQLAHDPSGNVIWRDQTQVSDGLAAILDKMVRCFQRHRYQSVSEALDGFATVN